MAELNDIQQRIETLHARVEKESKLLLDTYRDDMLGHLDEARDAFRVHRFAEAVTHLRSAATLSDAHYHDLLHVSTAESLDEANEVSILRLSANTIIDDIELSQRRQSAGDTGQDKGKRTRR